MITAYFLTGSFNDQDNDFELKVIVSNNASTTDIGVVYDIVLIDISNNSSSLWETSAPTFLECLDVMDAFLSDNFITLYSKIIITPQRDPQIDKELEGFILNRLEY